MNGKVGNSTENGIEDYLMGYQKIYEHIPDGVTIFDMNGSLLWCNKAALDIYGYSDQEEVLGTTYSEYIHPENRMEVVETFQRVERGEIILLLDDTFTAFRKDGTQFPAHVRTTPIIVEDKFVDTGLIVLPRHLYRVSDVHVTFEPDTFGGFPVPHIQADDHTLLQHDQPPFPAVRSRKFRSSRRPASPDFSGWN